MSSSKKIERPMCETEEMYLFEQDDYLMEKYHFDPSNGGKWICFIDISSMDSMWAKACKLYRHRELVGIASIKTSTAKYNPRQTSVDQGVIAFHCGPCDDETLMMQYGRNIVAKFDFSSKFGYMPYKSDSQSAMGTRGTGNVKNNLYRIPVPKPSHLRNIVASPVRENLVPSEVTDRVWLIEGHDTDQEDFETEEANLGHWLLFYKKGWLDRAWKKACLLHRDDELQGIQFMKVSTDQQMNYVSGTVRSRDTGIILCFCGPSDDVDLVTRYGKNLAKKMNYFSQNGRMGYSFAKKTLFRIPVASPRERRESSESSNKSN